MPKKHVTASVPVATISADDVQVGGPAVPTVDSSDVAVTPTGVQPDLTVHDPVTYSGLIGQNFLQMQHAQSLPVTVDDITKVEQDSLAKAQDYRKAVAQQAQEARTRVGERQALITSPGYVDKDGNPIPAGQPVPADAIRIPSIAEREETLKAKIEAQKQLEEEQARQGPSATAVATAQPGGITSGIISRPESADRNRMDAYSEGLDNIIKLHQLYENMVNNSAMAGGQFRSGFGLLSPLNQMTSDSARAYHAFVESNLIPIAKGIMGDAATTAGRENVQLSLKDSLPKDTDTIAKAGQLIYNLGGTGLNNMETMRNTLKANGYDTSAWDSKILDLQNYMKSPAIAKYDALANPLVNAGSSNQANAIINSVRAGATAGIQMPAQQQIQQPIGQAGAYQMPPSPPAPPQPNIGQQGSQADIAAARAAGQLAGSTLSGVGSDIQTLGRGAGSTLDWLKTLLPENYPQSAYDKPRPWDTNPEYVGQ